MMLVATDNSSLVLNADSSEDKKVISDLSVIANQSISKLTKAHPQLLIFPDSFESNEDDISKSSIFELRLQGSKTILETGNIMGFIGVQDTQLKIQSRFAQASSNNQEDYFLHYMLHKVLKINVLDLKHSRSQTNVFDFLVYLFVYYLKKALSQGLYKAYQKKRYNDSNLKGVIDIQTHIKRNQPFQGNMAYVVREYSFDNRITQLIRHTIQLIQKRADLRDVLHSDSDTLEFVNLIVQHTPSYHARERQTVIHANRMPFVHPYFTEYAHLQKICLQLLRYEGLKYAKSKDKAYGVIFDGAWLWEEYLNTLLKSLDFEHPQNKSRKGGVYVYASKYAGNNVRRFPDFVKDKKIILDAKYKRMADNNISREDLNQIISYLYLYRGVIGGFIAPSEEDNIALNMGVLNGYGGKLYKFKLAIPQVVNSYQQFKTAIEINENVLIDSIQQLLVMKDSVKQN